MRRAISKMQPAQAASAASSLVKNDAFTGGFETDPTAFDQTTAHAAGGVAIARIWLAFMDLQEERDGFVRGLRFCSTSGLHAVPLKGLVPANDVPGRLLDMTGEVLVPGFRRSQRRAVRAHVWNGKIEEDLVAQMLAVFDPWHEKVKLVLTGLTSREGRQLAIAA